MLQVERDSLERRERVAESRDVGRDELVGTVDATVEVDDLVEVVFGAEVQIMDVAGEAGAEGNGQLLLKVANLPGPEVSNSKGRASE